jgi:hypothetical protein
VSDVRFAVVIPLHNRSELIAGALGDVFSQSLPAAEVIVVDDGSIDGGADFVEQLYPAARMIRQPHDGVSTARNTGIAASSSPWVALLDADDRWGVDHLRGLAETITTFSAARLVASGIKMVAGPLPAGWRPPAAPEGQPPGVVDYFRAAAKQITVVTSSSSAIHRGTALELGGFGPYGRGEDQEFWARLALAHPVALTGRVTAFWVRGVGGVTESPLGLDEVQPVPTTIEDVSPAAETVARHLPNDPSDARRSSMMAYLDSRVVVAMRRRVAGGDLTGARQMVRLLHHPRSASAAVVVAVSHLPSPVVRSGLRLKRRLREQIRTLTSQRGGS